MKYGYIETYRNYRIINTPTNYVITNINGLTVGSVKTSLTGAEGFIDELIDGFNEDYNKMKDFYINKLMEEYK